MIARGIEVETTIDGVIELSPRKGTLTHFASLSAAPPPARAGCRRLVSVRAGGAAPGNICECRQALPRKGSGRLLEARGIIRSRYAFDVVRMVKHGTLKAGDRFDHPATVFGRVLTGYGGATCTHRVVTVPEGYNLFDIATAVEAAQLATRDDFRRRTQGHRADCRSGPDGHEPGGIPVSGYLPLSA